MTKHEKDISQLKKYLEGKLDARSMYELERRAQDDPFLQDMKMQANRRMII